VGVALVGARPRVDPRRCDGQPRGPLLPFTGPAARARRRLPVHRLVAGVQRGRPVRGRRGDPVGCAVAVRIRFRFRREAPAGRRRRFRERMTTRSMPVPEGLAGMRVDAGLARLLGLSRTAAAAIAEEGGVELDGARAAKSDKLTAGAWLEVRLPEAPAPVENT